MTRDEALAVITKALIATVGSVDGDLAEDTNLVDDGLLDSLDSMTFLFELENDLRRLPRGRARRHRRPGDLLILHAVGVC
jgi:hypothetical protein